MRLVESYDDPVELRCETLLRLRKVPKGEPEMRGVTVGSRRPATVGRHGKT